MPRNHTVINSSLKGSNGDEIARSDFFEDTVERYASIGLVRRTIPNAIVEDQLF